METLKYLKNKVFSSIQNKIQHFGERNASQSKTQVNIINVQPVECQRSASGDKRKTQPNDGNNNDADETNNEGEHVKALHLILRIVNILCRPVGIQLHADWKFNIITAVATSLVVTAALLDSYTIYMLKGNYLKIIESLSLQGMLIPGACKLHLSCTALNEILSLYRFAEEVYVQNSNGRKADILTKNTNRIAIQIFSLLCLAIPPFCCFVGYPLYKFIFHRELIPLMTLQIPYVDQSKRSGFITANLIMMVYGLYGACGSVSFDVMFALIVMLYSSLVNLLRYDLERLGNMWQNEDKTAGEDFRHAFLRNIVLQIGDVDRYAKRISDIFSDFIFVQMATAYACVSMALFSVIINHWISGVGYAAYCFAEMFMICYLGTILSIQNEELCSSLYNHPWYLYPKKTQKVFVFLLHMVQNFTELTVGSLAILNIETGMRMTNNIYSYLTMLISFFE